ncbi:T-complex protein 1 subunit theta [Helicoverpa armigera]|uniref:T-complex protein 1 subunit theta n=1 Tax=Helicoverpa armigera TaxID=29058 RepID=UPI001F580FC0|nr:T-complex protein 1 subunit theta [Helicoverpa armigera]XP_047025022.1 T-complex protein 1 subunit theta [Helicoverpa zea]
MALHVPKAPGVPQMLKEGARMFSGLEEAVYRNINACKQFAQSVRSAYGPNGMNKMIINHIDKQFVTSDAGTIIRELDVEHPAAKLMVLASQMQDSEVGDGTNFVIVFSGALLEAAEELLRLGVTPTEIADGYEKALEKCLEILPGLVCEEIKDCKNVQAVVKGITPSIMSKQYGYEDFIAELVAKACVAILPEKTTFNVDNVRICKILGSGLLQSEVLSGMVFKREVEGDVPSATKAKVAVYSCPVDITQTETKGTVLIKSADELLNFSRGEESQLEKQIKEIADSGVKVVVAGAKFGDMALHFLNKYGIMAVRLNSKFDIRRLARTVNATVLPRLTTPTAEELGYCDSVGVEELGDTRVVCFRMDSTESRISTVVIRGSTDNYMDDIERAIDDGVNTFKGIARDGKFLPGAGATEIELAQQLLQYADTLPGLEQYAVRKFAVALESIPRALADNSGANATEVVNNIYKAHKEGNKNAGYDIESENNGVCDAKEKNILDLYVLKYWGLKYAVGAAATILKVDQIIMAKRAGGPKPKAPAGSDDES